MTSDEAGRPKSPGKNKARGPCLHQRVVEAHYDEHHNPTGKVLCRECGAIIPDSIRTHI